MARNPRSRPRIEWPEDDRYRPCGKCDRCKHAAGRDLNPRATDCYDDMLTAALRPTRRSA